MRHHGYWAAIGRACHRAHKGECVYVVRYHGEYLALSAPIAEAIAGVGDCTILVRVNKDRVR